MRTDNSRADRTLIRDWRRLAAHLPLLRGQLPTLVSVVAIMLTSTAITLAIPLVAGRFVDQLADTGGLSTSRRGLFLLGGLLLAQLAGSFLYSYLSRRLGLLVVTRLRRRLFGHLLSLPSLYFTHKKAGDLSSRMTSDVGSIQYILTSGITSFIGAVVTLVGAVILMFRVNVQLTLVVVLLVPATILLVSLFGRHLRRLSRRMYDDLGELSNHVQEVAGAIRPIKVFGSQDHEQARFEGRLGTFMDAGLKRALLSSVLDAGAQLLLWVCLITVVVYGFYLTTQGATTAGQLVAFMLLVFRVAAPMGSLTSLYASGQGAVAAAARLDDVFRTPPESVSMGQTAAGHAPTAAPATSGLDLVDVRFRYTAPDEDAGADDAPVWTLDGVSLHVAPGERVALVGPSGAGKTTVAGLVLRLFDPQEGALFLDGRPYRDHDLRDLRGRMAYVPQEAVLYDASVADNIRFGLADASDQAVRDAAARAQALDFIERLPDGFGTLVGDRGVRLSGGERQRLALARAFLRNPAILVLDEPTSALDAANESAIREALAELMAGRTTIMVAHRFSLVRDLDRIVVLDGGKVRESGTHDELLARQGLYARLFQLQHGT